MSSLSFPPSEAPEAPVLLLAFNRPATTQRVFDELRRAAPPRLYVAVDGPRPERPGEIETVRHVREIVTAIDWNCEVKTLFRAENLGCRAAVSSAIDWFFEHEPAGIILEDDCLPHPSFFRFCSALLHRYANDTRVMTISGNNFQLGRSAFAHSYYFSRYMHCWGWASWRRAWQHYDRNLATWPHLRNTAWLETLFPHPRHARYWRRLLDRVAHGEIDTWDYIWQYSIWTQQGLNVLPHRNLVSNIGFDEHATHTTTSTSMWANMTTGAMNFPLHHPPVMPNVEADHFTQEHVHKAPRLSKRILRKLQTILSA